jgi:hypothetical protein
MYKIKMIKLEKVVTCVKSCPVRMPKSRAIALLSPRNCSESGCGDAVFDPEEDVFILIICVINVVILSLCPTERMINVKIIIVILARNPVQLKKISNIGKRKKGINLVNAANVSAIQASG